MARTRRWRLFDMGEGRHEPFVVDNPPLVIVNAPDKRGHGGTMGRVIQMRRNRYGQFVAKKSTSGRKRAAKKGRPRKNAPAAHGARGRTTSHTTRARKNPPFWTAGRTTSNARRAPRKNPPVLSMDKTGRIGGLSIPAAQDVIAIAGGIAGPPIVKGFTVSLIPAAYQGKVWVKWGTEIVGYGIPIFTAKMIGGARAMRWVIAGELASLLVRAATALMANAPQLGRRRAMRGYIPNVSQKQLRGYIPGVSQKQLRAVPKSGRRMSANRSRRQSRFAA